jgi:hypothetical protein
MMHQLDQLSECAWHCLQGGGAFTLVEVAVSDPARFAILRQAGRIDSQY